METEYTMHLEAGPFARIKQGTKKMEARLQDAKRLELKVGDTIRFVNIDDPTQVLRVEIIGLHAYISFAKLLDHFNSKYYFGSGRKEVLKRLRDRYKKREHELGVLGILMKVIPEE